MGWREIGEKGVEGRVDMLNRRGRSQLAIGGICIAPKALWQPLKWLNCIFTT
jgi:hypothetical protein